LLVDDDRLHLGAGPRENNARPAIDAMLRSVAVCCGSRAIGVVLTGTLGDGASGLWAINRCGGMSVVQDPKDAAFAEMPLNALNRAKPDHIVSLAQLPVLLESMVHEPAGTPVPTPDSIKFEVEIARNGRATMDDMDRLGRRSVLACPDCHGVMWEIDEGDLVRYRCHVGHTYNAELMSLALDDNLRHALASALRALEERLSLARKLYDQSKEFGDVHAQSWAAKAREYEREMKTIREAIGRMDDIAARADRAQTEAAQ
jgi:two-component system chemotaxis response regulator CheB